MKKKMMVLAALVLAVVVSAYSVSGTYAKYTSTATGTSTGTVAKWSIKVGETEIASTNAQTYTFNLFDSVKDTKDGANETDVVAGLIAPGTEGSFELEITNASEVNATYSLSLADTNVSNIPIEYSTDGGNSWKKTIADVNVTDATLAMSDTTVTKTVQWRWVYSVGEEGDTADTALGIAAQTSAPTVEVVATVTATQVD